MNTLAIAQIISGARLRVAELLAADPDTDAAALLAVVEQEEPAFADVMTALCRAADEAQGCVNDTARRMDDLATRHDRFIAQRDEYRRLIFAAMDAAGQRKWKSPEFTVSIQDGRAGVVITDPQAVPDQFVRIKREPDKTAIGAALASGNAVPGADMRNGAPSLTIRTK
jgi:hypothetical protein